MSDAESQNDVSSDVVAIHNALNVLVGEARVAYANLYSKYEIIYNSLSAQMSKEAGDKKDDIEKQHKEALKNVENMYKLKITNVKG
jgi:hypothetical protein